MRFAPPRIANGLAIALIAVASLFPLPALAAGPGDYSGAITTGGTSQQALPAQGRAFVLCENPSATASSVSAESLFINFGAAASGTISANTGSIELANGATLLLNLQNSSAGVLAMQFNVVAATTGHKYICKQG